MIPPHDAVTGCLPPGRYLTSLDEIRDRFVLDDEYSSSSTRVRNWAGFNDYLDAWSKAEAAVEQKVLVGVWIAGSFVTNRSDPSDIDVTPLYDKAVIPTLYGKPGVKQLKKLLGDRKSVKEKFHVEAFPLGWAPSLSSLFPEKLEAREQQYLLSSGGLTDWWQRETRTNAIGSPLTSNQYAYKGFLEVLL